MKNSLYMMIIFLDNQVETIRNMQTVLQLIDELDSFIIDPDEDADDSFINEEDMPF